ncbi:Innexin inx1 [Orchesella cincta]|uniref:Innexin n=1 Tax=Orchesella cincta TaxID=48709 RepID=A0A1D2MAJ1_ORCCI|nr:Innexin inx1 [Orchesella cincta]
MLRLWADYTRRQEIIIDNPIFRIHSSFTTVLLLTFSIIITWTDLVGQPIRCQVSGVPAYMVTSYCWIETTFLMSNAFLRPASSAHPGLGNDYNDETSRKHYNYYQWVCFALFFQALLCHFPKWLWERWEDGLMTRIVCGLNIPLRPETEKSWRKGILSNYLVKHRIIHRNWYTLRYWFCELLCLVNIILQMVFMNWFFKGDFLLYGLKVLTFDDKDQEERYDHMIYVFPRVTKCIFRKFGPSGSIEKHDAICILPQNNFSEKIYIFIWFWFIILAVLIAALVIFRVFLICMPRLRSFLLFSLTRMVPKEVVDSICRRVSVGDWWILYMLGRNVDPQIYKEVIADLAEKEHTVKYIIIRIPPQCCGPTNWFLKLFYAIC